MEHEANHARPPLDDADARILTCLSHEPFSSIRLIAQALGLALAAVPQHLAISLDKQPRHSHWVPHKLTRRLRNQQVQGARALLDVLR
jgi:hypothetical protein